MQINDTIAAVSTPPGTGAISIVRLSGQKSLQIIKKIFQPIKKTDITRPGFYNGIIKFKNKVIDQVVILVRRCPHSYTGEDLIEINCHGGMLITRDVLKTVLENKARLACPGEFTKRAFLNKKIDLTQAEAINDLIMAKTEKSKQYALEQLFGKFSGYVDSLRKKLIQIMAKLEVSLDHPEEDIDTVTGRELKAEITQILSQLEQLLKTAHKGLALHYGINAVIAGKANVGKSSLFNFFLKKDRALVSDIPGTTRDIIEDWLDIEGIPVKLVDTAGFKKAFDIIDHMSVQKTHQAIETSHMILAVFDATKRIEKEDENLINKLSQVKSKAIYILNKTDRPLRINRNRLKNLLKTNIIEVSALEGKGLEKIEKKISQIVMGSDQPGSDIMITNLRYESSMREAKSHLEEVLKGLKEQRPMEILASDIRRAILHLEEIIGKFTTEDLLDSIFSGFCIGK
ncbi:MAG: tRNA uridine-5-carboxymethylaminomethyl(34) synthesis GTPase MnmE [Spirochaetes bacterium]|nr:tRNA uridine-5-carboxymethylaminomethyl(34) synthesis GTPase MnmE [Spirochaetota bacterium]